MASDEIITNRSANSDAQALGNARDAMRQAVSQVLSVYGLLQHQTDGATFTNLEARYGWAAGQGAAVYGAWQYVALLFGAPQGASTAIEGHFDLLINRLQ